MTRPLYRRGDLHRLLAPRSIAIVGASEKPGAFSNRTLDNLAHFQGQVYLVNPKYRRIGERPCYSSLAALPETPDCVIVALPREAVVDEVREAAELGAGGAIIYASGFAETGFAERVAQQQAIAQIARNSGLRVLGPNCVGVVNNLIGAGMLFQMGFSDLDRMPGRVGLVSQSGALGYALLQGTQHGRGYTHMLASGNSCDVAALDLASYLVDEPECKVVACVLEGVGDITHLYELGERSAAASKPVIVCKTAIAEAGAEVAKSHTGSLAGSYEAFVAAMRRGNFVLVDSMAELAEAADFFAKAKAPNGTGVAVMATSGGAAVMSADSALRYGVVQPQPRAEAQAILDANIPEFGSSRNPCDITGQVLNNPDSFIACTRAMLQDPSYAVLVLPQVTASKELAQQRCEVVSRLTAEAGKPTCIVWLSEWLEGPGAQTYARDDRLVLFRSMDRCFKTIALWQKWHRAARARPQRYRRLTPATAVAQARQLLQDQPEVVTEHVAKQVVSLYNVQVVREIASTSKEAAVAAACELGFPVVLKLDSPDAAHKTELGAVRVGLCDAESVAEACEDMLTKVQGARSGAFLLQSMVQGSVEMMLGMKRDPVFGPVVMVGLGGIFVEVFGDVATAIAPVSPEQAQEMLAGLASFRLLQGYRGKPGVDMDALTRTVACFSELCVDLADEVDEIDVNPLICGPRGATAVDALIVLRPVGKR